jgi:hypothetical protein
VSSEERITRVINEHKQPVNITLTKGAKGRYRWSIDVRAEDVDQALYMLEEADRKLREQFLEQPLPNQHGEAAGPDKPKDPHSRMDQALRNIKKAGENPVSLWGDEK